MLTQQEVKERIPNTWPLFFARHGRFTPVQQQTIPHILEGHDVLIVAGTATGKTEAVMAPLLELNWQQLKQPKLRMLYICPTRALVRDLYERLHPALDDTGITMGMKTGDVQPGTQYPTILLTTPESTDSLLTRSPRLFIDLWAIILDEIHLFDNTPRGDHVRCLLPRIERIRQYARPDAEPAQRVALSATILDPQGVAQRYLQDGVVVQIPSDREIVADIRPLYDLEELVSALAGRPSFKSLVFCNSREEVESAAVYLRQHLPHFADIFVHYSNLDAAMRREVEEQFAHSAVAVCVATSTLELGVDIGSVDDVVLLGAPPDVTSFLQRIGRGSRRAEKTQVLCMPKSPGEWARFEALLSLAQEIGHQRAEKKALGSSFPDLQSPSYSFRPSVLVQQIFSLIRQSPTGSVRPADVRRIAPAEVTAEDIRKLLSHLAYAGYLQSGRPGEWKPDEKLQILLDQHEIYSNIGAEVLGIVAVDAHTGRTIAHTDQVYPKGTVVLFGGKPMEVVWYEKYRFGLAPAPDREADHILRIRKSYAAIPFVVTQTVARSLALEPGQMAILPQEPGTWLFHFWGTVWGSLLTTVLIANGIGAEFVNEYCLYTEQPMTQLPPWDEKAVEKAARRTAMALASRLEMGRFHHLLPADIVVSATLDQVNLARFGQLFRAATITDNARIYQQLHSLTG